MREERETNEALQRIRATIPSKLNCPVKVPATALTLTAVRNAEPLYAIGAHATAVADVHAVQPHGSATASDAVGVTTTLPKLMPIIVTDPPEVTPMFGGMLMLTHGAANPHSAMMRAPLPERIGRPVRLWRLPARSYRRR